MNFYLTFILLISFVNYHAGFDLSCKDENGNPVDYFMNYRVPKLGSGYLYYAKGQSEDGWRTSSNDIFDEESMIGQTFKDVYDHFKGGKKSNKLKYLQYNNEQKSSGKSFGKGFGQSKGTIVWNKNRAIWLLHSMPLKDGNGNIFMPSFKSSNEYEYQSPYGHMALCINLNYNDLGSILSNLLAINVKIYDKNVDDFELNFVKQIKPFELRKDLETAANQQFTIHTKLFTNVEHMWATKWLTNDDLKSTFLSKKSNKNTNCDKRNIADILELEATLNGKKIKWSYENDKSRWSIDVTNDKLCFSDFNRDDFNSETFVGNVLCLNDSKLHGMLNSLIKSRSCKRQ